MNSLVKLDLIQPEKVVEIYPRVRDRDDVAVLKCTASGIIFLSRTDHVSEKHYESKEQLSYWSAGTREEGLKLTADDDRRRFESFKELLRGKDCLDVGTGMGGFLDLSQNVAKKVSAVELQTGARTCLQKLGYEVYENIGAIPSQAQFDLITLFHVFEHILDPLQSLKDLFKHLRPSGKIVIEVPHANDALITTFNLDEFKKMTFWSEHLLLHTRQSIHRYLEAAGFKDVTVSGVQRYPLANHLHWLHQKKPNGHNVLSQFRNPKLEREYEKLLDSINQTDTLIAIAEKP